MSTVVYVIVALVLLWPLVRLLLPRKAHVPVLDEAVHEIEEAHAHHGATTAVAVERRAEGPDRPHDGDGR
jgi:putative tricarboxylic transport membrane protein